MKPKRWQQLEMIFHSALELMPEQRPAFLDEIIEPLFETKPDSSNR